jgi:hypothetical protein
MSINYARSHKNPYSSLTVHLLIILSHIFTIVLGEFALDRRIADVESRG